MEKSLESPEHFTEWLCITHNMFTLDRKGKNIKTEEEYLRESEGLFVCTQENLRKRWGPL